MNAGFVDENTIKDYWLIEYDNTGNRIGFPRYYEYNEATQNVRIIVPTDPSHVFKGVILVNTHNKDLFDQENDMSMSDTLECFNLRGDVSAIVDLALLDTGVKFRAVACRSTTTGLFISLISLSFTSEPRINLSE